MPNAELQSDSLISRGHDICALWDAIVTGVPNPGLTQAIRWGRQFTDKQIEASFSRTYCKLRSANITADACYRYATSSMAGMKRDQQQQQSSKK